MGAMLSNSTEGGNGPGLGDIPESCISYVFTYLTPPEICDLARLNRAFRGAASSDSVWEPKLPPNFQDLLDLLPPEKYQNLSKKDIFAILSRSVPFDDGTKACEVWLDKVTGRVCMSISAKAMAITGIEDRRYWNWVPTEESSWYVERDHEIGEDFMNLTSFQVDTVKERDFVKMNDAKVTNLAKRPCLCEQLL
ncbi:hypothetical protein HHK36_016721 [Tetracentron sinense]|uniref:F-box domain-containing protein n=1 Tax=Tetracentron sinense TaxID=13715 RepID=A0A835DBS3_TETSI|nr:hypothetical protein HHK36_016721 [Tetracentron sinense]